MWQWVKGLFGGGGSGPGDDGLYYYVQCDRCGDRVRVRINPYTELQQEFSAAHGNVSGYVLHKWVVDSRCYQAMEMVVRFDAGRREVDREIAGGRFISEADFAAE